MARTDKAAMDRETIRPLKRPSLVDEMIAQLETRLVSGEFNVGDKLPPKAALIKELALGRTTLREAVRVLQHVGLLTVRHGSGTYVRSKSGEGMLASQLRQARALKVFEVPRALELEMMLFAATHRTAFAIRDALGEMRRSLELRSEKAFPEADMEIYKTLAPATRNSIPMEIYFSFAEALRFAATQVATIPEAMKGCLASHEQLFEVILADDGDRAVDVAKRHLDRVTRLIEVVLSVARRRRAGSQNQIWITFVWSAVDSHGTWVIQWLRARHGGPFSCAFGLQLIASKHSKQGSNGLSLRTNAILEVHGDLISAF
jgi:DNA-binding FadR family transcriptional regulator